MRKWVRKFLGLATAALILFSIANIGIYFLHNYNSKKINKALEQQVVAPVSEPPEAAASASGTSESPNGAVPITVDFDALLADYPDIVGWLHCPGTPINYPILQGENNSYYLNRLPNKIHNANGSIFMDHRNASDFSNRNTIIYGHNIRNGTMFGSLKNYRNQDYYEANPTMWLLLPEQNYQLELTAGCVVRSDSHLYNVPDTGADAVKQVKDAMADSSFISGHELTEDDFWVTLSTCSYEFDNARYIVLCRMIPVD